MTEDILRGIRFAYFQDCNLGVEVLLAGSVG